MQNTEYAVEGDLFYVHHFHLAGRENDLVRKKKKGVKKPLPVLLMSFHSSIPSVVIFSLLGFQLPHLCVSTAYPHMHFSS